MPVEMIGWIAPRVSSEIIPPSGPPFAAEVVARPDAARRRALNAALDSIAERFGDAAVTRADQADPRRKR